MSNQGCEGGLAWGQEGTVQWEVTGDNTEPRAAERPEPELLTNAPVRLRVLNWRVLFGTEVEVVMVMRVGPSSSPSWGFMHGTLTEGLWWGWGPHQHHSPNT